MLVSLNISPSRVVVFGFLNIFCDIESAIRVINNKKVDNDKFWNTCLLCVFLCCTFNWLLFLLNDVVFVLRKSLGCCQSRQPVYQAIWANNSAFDEVLVSPSMINDHMPDYVLEALEKVILSFIFHFFFSIMLTVSENLLLISEFISKWFFYSSMSGYEEFLKYFFIMHCIFKK